MRHVLSKLRRSWKKQQQTCSERSCFSVTTRGERPLRGRPRAVRRRVKAPRNQGGRSPLARDPALDPALDPGRGEVRRAVEGIPSAEVVNSEGLRGRASGASLLSAARMSGPAEGPTGGPPRLQAVGPCHNTSGHDRHGYSDSLALIRPINLGDTRNVVPSRRRNASDRFNKRRRAARSTTASVPATAKPRSRAA